MHTNSSCENGVEMEKESMKETIEETCTTFSPHFQKNFIPFNYHDCYVLGHIFNKNNKIGLRHIILCTFTAFHAKKKVPIFH